MNKIPPGNRSIRAPAAVATLSSAASASVSSTNTRKPTSSSATNSIKSRRRCEVKAETLKTENGVVIKDKYAFRATLKDIQDNDYNLNIPRYVDTFEEEVAIDVAETKKTIGDLKKELTVVEQKMNEYLKELGF